MDNYIKFARSAKDKALLARIASMAMEDQVKAIGQGATTTDPRWAVPAIAEAWCYATISLSEGYSGSIACGSDYRSNRGLHIQPDWQADQRHRETLISATAAKIASQRALSQ